MALVMGLAAITMAAVAEPPVRLEPGRPVQTEMGAADVKEWMIALRQGESVELVVEQQGIDVVVDLFSPRGALLDSVDSPNGRQGPEPVAFIAREGGAYRLRVRAIADNEPRGRLTVNVAAFRNVAETRRLLDGRRRVRQAVAGWLGRSDAPLPADGRVDPGASLSPFDALASSASVIGLGEATHGSREFNDFRVAMVQRLVMGHGYRVIALEDSASRWRALEDYVEGRSASPETEMEWGWIGRRARRGLLEWARQWNLDHPGDIVRIVGVDAQDNQLDRELLGAFIGRFYGAAAATAWTERARELAAADVQTAVFGNSGTSVALRQYMHEIVAQLSSDAAWLRVRFGVSDYDAAMQAALSLAAFVDFNTGEGAVSHSRDWHMAAALLRAIERDPRRPKAVYWGHNSHVSAAVTSWGPTGALLRQALGCNYRAVASTFGAGEFIAQIPNDPADRLTVARVAPAAPDDETIETALASVRPGAHLSAWECDGGREAPQWLRDQRPLRWIGGLYAPDSAPSAAYRSYSLPQAFDAIVYFPRVSAEAVPTDRPVIPPRQR